MVQRRTQSKIIAKAKERGFKYKERGARICNNVKHVANAKRPGGTRKCAKIGTAARKVLRRL